MSIALSIIGKKTSIIGRFLDCVFPGQDLINVSYCILGINGAPCMLQHNFENLTVDQQLLMDMIAS